MEYKKIVNYNTFEDGVFFSYVSIFNFEDSCEDIIINNAFKNNIKQKNIVPLLWQHKKDEVIGIVYNFKEDYMGLYVEGQINSKKYNKIYSFIKNNMINVLSIGYITNNFVFDKKGRRIIKSL